MILDTFFKKINLIQEFELNFEMDKAIFLDKLKNELSVKRSTKEYILDSFMSEEDFLKVVFNKNSFVLELIPEFLVRKDFVNHFKLICKIEDSQNGFKIKAKLLSDDKVLLAFFLFFVFFLLMINIITLVQGEVFILLSIPVFLLVFGLLYLYQITYLKRLKARALKLFKKLS